MTENVNNTIVNDSKLTTFVPSDYSDVGQGALLSEVYGHCLRFCEGVGWIVYKNGRWILSDIEAHKYSQKLTDLQLQEADEMKKSALLDGKKSVENEKYYKYTVIRRTSARITATLKEARPKLRIRTSDLDRAPLILNTPHGEVDLSTGEEQPHDSAHYITHMTTVSPSNEGTETWNSFLSEVSCGDAAVADFLQQIVGMAAIGKVYEERLIIALGSGGNGKSTFFNAIQGVLGDYAGTIRSELIISSSDSGKKFEYASLRGVRFVVAEELSENKQLDTGAIKQLCSTGDINAQFKGKDVFTFKPSHLAVLCTNYMPMIKAADNGTWDRIIVIPFEARFRTQEKEIKNYGAYLVEHCGGAILSWIIEGAQKYIQNDYKLQIPQKIQTLVDTYKEEYVWSTFCKESLLFKASYSATGSELYEEYMNRCSLYNATAQPLEVALQRIEKHRVTKIIVNEEPCYHGVGVVRGR